MTDTTNQTDPTDPTDPADPTPTSAGASTPRKRSRRRTLLISGGAVLASAALIGGGVAVGAAIADEIDDQGESTSETSETDDDGTDSTDTGDADDTDETTATGTASASELLEIIETASAEADGEPVGIEATDAESWEVEFVTSAGEESEVRVDPDGTAVVVSTETADQDDEVPQGSLDAATVEALVKAALAETDGAIVGIEIDGDAASPYDVTVVTSDRKTVEIALDSDFAVLTADSDDD